MSRLPLALLVLAAACGGGQTRGHPLDLDWDDLEGSELAAFQKSFAPAPAPSLPSIAVGVVDEDTLVGRDLDLRRSWRFDHPLEGRPCLAGGVVVGLGGGFLFALDAHDGELLWTRRALGSLRGVADDGATTLVSIASLSRKRSTILAVLHDGTVVRQIHEQALIGAPAVFDAYAFLPYDGTSVVVFDLIEGHETARVLTKEPVSHAFLAGGQLYFGEREAVRFDRRIVAAREGGGTNVVLPARALPGGPRWLSAGAEPAPLRAGTSDAVRLYARPEGHGDGARLGSLALGYHELVVGLDPTDGRTLWVDAASAPLLAAYAGEEALSLCTRAGEIRWHEPRTGARLYRDVLGTEVTSCVVQSERPPRREPIALGTHVEQLATAMRLGAPRLAPMQLELLADLDAISGEESTAALIELARRVPGASRQRAALADDAAARLARRRSGAAAITTALTRAAEGDESLPIGALARAAVAQDVRDAAGPLATLLNGSLAAGDLAAVVAALDRLAHEDQRRALALFVARQGCPRDDEPLALAVLGVARTLVRVGGSDVVRAASARCEDPAMGQRLLELLRGRS